MNKFLTPRRAEHVSFDDDGRPIDQLLADLVFQSDRFGTRVTPAGFRTNYASVPRLPVIFLVAGDRAHAPAAGHDKGYTDADKSDLSRLEWDLLFLEMLLAPTCTEVQKPTPPWLAQAMFRAVRLFGQSAWDKTSTIWQPPPLEAP